MLRQNSCELRGQIHTQAVYHLRVNRRSSHSFLDQCRKSGHCQQVHVPLGKHRYHIVAPDHCFPDHPNRDRLAVSAAEIDRWGTAADHPIETAGEYPAED